MARQHGVTRLYVTADLTRGARLSLDADRAHYLGGVLRARVGDHVILFNGRDGAWHASITELGKRGAALELTDRQCKQPVPRDGADLALAFALTKRTANQAIVQKATELGVGEIIPVVVARGGRPSFNEARYRAIAVAAAEQCGRLTVPRLAPPRALGELLAAMASERHILLADETGGGDPVASLDPALAQRKLLLLIGPEGGFTPAELDAARQTPNLTLIDLGPRILRADTAAIAGLAVIQSLLGDWRRT